VAFSLGMESFFPPWESSHFHDTCQFETCFRKRKLFFNFVFFQVYLLCLLLLHFTSLLFFPEDQVFHFLPSRHCKFYTSRISGKGKKSKPPLDELYYIVNQQDCKFFMILGLLATAYLKLEVGVPVFGSEKSTSYSSTTNFLYPLLHYFCS